MSKQTKIFEEDEPKMLESMDLKMANQVANSVLTMVDSWCKKAVVVGSIRRLRPEIHDVDFVVLPYEDDRGAHWKGIRNSMITLMSAKVVVSGDKILRMLMLWKGDEYVQVDFYKTTADTYGVYELIRTGSFEHNIWLAKLALRKGMRLRYSEGLVGSEGNVIAGKTERGIFKALGLKFIEPELREMKGGKPVWR